MPPRGIDSLHASTIYQPPSPTPPGPNPLPPDSVTEKLKGFAAPQPTLLTVHLDNVTAYIQDSLDLTSPPMISTTGNTNGKALTVSSGTGLVVGMGVSGRDIPAGATLASGSGTLWELSIPAAVPANGVALTFTNIIVDLVHSAMQPNVSIDISIKPNNPKSPFYNMFPLVVVGDIVGINGDPTVTGLYLSKNLVTISSSVPATAAPTSTPISAGQMVSDAPIVGFRHDIFKILYPDTLPTPPPYNAPVERLLSPLPPVTMELGSITAAGVSGQPVPPGGPLEIQGGDWAITGGTGAFLGVTGQMGGGEGGGAIRMASVTEDPSQRRNNAANANPPATATMGLYVIPLMPPQIINVFHDASGLNPLPMPVTLDNPAKVGDRLILYATGLGPVRYQDVNNDWVDVPIGQPFPPNATVISPVSVTINTTQFLFGLWNHFTVPIAPQSAQGCQGFSNGYSVEFILPGSSSIPFFGEASIQINSAWIPSAAIPLYMFQG